MYCFGDKVKIISKGPHKGKVGEVIEVYQHLDVEIVYTIKYDNPKSNLIAGQFKHSELMRIDMSRLKHLL